MPGIDHLRFDNRFVDELPGEGSERDDAGNRTSRRVVGACWSRVDPTPVRSPSLVAYSPEMAAALDLEESDVRSSEFAAAFSGNRLLPGMYPFATCYGGHQFGHWAGQLGDGRAISLGEAMNPRGERWELQLKGAGTTPYSRHADGRAVLRSSLREFLCSEAMHHLGVPTTRALSLVLTGETVVRDMFYDGNPRPEPGAIVCRASPSFVRFGHFELFARRGAPGDLQILNRLIDFTISRDFPEFSKLPKDEQRSAWFREVCVRTARLMVDWMRVGFVHGVMNTDNMSILGLTIDYGPYGWIDHFDPAWTPNTTDAHGRRYCFGRQPGIALWNLARLSEALEPAFPSRSVLDECLEAFSSTFNAEFPRSLGAKFGFETEKPEDMALIERALELLNLAEVDMTEFFRSLASVSPENPRFEALTPAFYSEKRMQGHRDDFTAWLSEYASRLRQDGLRNDDRRARMNRVNPRFVLRNYLAQMAIDRAEREDYSLIEILMDMARRPYDEHPDRQDLLAIRPEWARRKAGCSMLSCSS